MMFTACSYLFLAAFLLSALVQYNDPDAIIWIAVYLAAAALSLPRLRARLPRWSAPLLYSVALVWIGTLLPAVVGKVSAHEIFASLTMQTRAVEEAREIGGLALVALWSGVLTLRRGR